MTDAMFWMAASGFLLGFAIIQTITLVRTYRAYRRDKAEVRS